MYHEPTKIDNLVAQRQSVCLFVSLLCLFVCLFVAYETTNIANLIAHRQGDQELPAVLLIPKHLDVEVGIGPIPLDDREEEVFAVPGEGRNLEGELSFEGVALDVPIVEDGVRLLGDAGEGVGAVAEDVLLDARVADLLLAAVGGARHQPVAAAHPVPLHLGFRI